MKVAYLQCPTGIAGDMCLGAIADAGVPLAYLTEQLGRLEMGQNYQLRTECVNRNGLRATKFQVELVSETGEVMSPDQFSTFAHANPTSVIHPSDSVSSSTIASYLIEPLIVQASLPPRVTTWSLAVFRQLITAESAARGVTPEQVYFHGVGIVDALIDIVGTCLGLDWLNIDRLVCSPLPTGGGMVQTAYGQRPAPTPTVLKLFEMGHVPVYHNGIEREMVTPTGAAIATTLATFGALPAMTLAQIGLGAGSSHFALPNILQLWIGEVDQESGELSLANSPKLTTHNSQLTTSSHPSTETVLLLETQIDDLNPQAIAYVMEQLLAAGALDVFTQAIGMKKSRPGTLLTVVCHPDAQAICETILFRETTTLGIRCSSQERRILPREIQLVPTEFGVVRVKVAWAEGRDRSPTNVQPEYEDCAQIARTQKLPWREVHRVALQTWYRQYWKSPNSTK